MTEPNNNDDWVEQPLHAAVSTGSSLRSLFVAVVCLVLGAWGVYDYVWSIPAQQEAYLRSEICRDVRSSIGGDTGADQVELTVSRIDQQLAGPAPDPSNKDAVAWRSTLQIFRDAVQRPSTMSPTDWPATRTAAGQLANAALERYGDTTPPSKFDRPMQWLFILCLPFVPYYLWVLFKNGSRKYRLDPDGTIHLPEATWTADAIADIDMNRWMAKSICWLENTDGTRIKLDAHIYKGLDTIIGVIAHRLHPGKWSLDARPVEATSSPDSSMTPGTESTDEA